jgi:hypothetical protein
MRLQAIAVACFLAFTTLTASAAFAVPQFEENAPAKQAPAAEANNFAPGDQIVFTGKPEFQTKQEANYFFSIAHEKEWDHASYISLDKLKVKLKKEEK